MIKILSNPCLYYLFPSYRRCDIKIGGGSQYGENCEVFDCLNTPIRFQGDRCGLFANPTLLLESEINYLYKQFWPCPGGCNLVRDNRESYGITWRVRTRSAHHLFSFLFFFRIHQTKCGENGYMTNGRSNFTYQSQLLATPYVFQCYDIMYGAMVGTLSDTNYCDSLPPLANEPCGCMGGPSLAPALQPPPNSATTPAPVPTSSTDTMSLAPSPPIPASTEPPTDGPVDSAAPSHSLYSTLGMYAMIGLFISSCHWSFRSL
jgi:hypothetical protein